MIYECTISGEGLIAWNGSAFECRGTENEQLLSLLVTDKSLECNDGTVKAQRKNNTSKLIITNSSLSGSNIECIHENGTNSIVIGNVSLPPIISTTSGKCCYYSDGHNNKCRFFSICIESPIYLQLINVYTDHLLFKWNKSVQCSSLRYEINATGCGNCSDHPVYVNDLIVTCDDVPINSTGENLCVFVVKAVVCESSESSSNSVTVTLKGNI